MKFLVVYSQYVGQDEQVIEYGNAITENPIEWFVAKRKKDATVILLNILGMREDQAEAIVETFR